ncbi:mediator of RNA polymerase II transcription subunit 10 [Hydra vulgaris]|uniref:Mediator of RNA polymerase II transcription subunit 10 n=1 Tax=Hydra vulgaris TaxID=6087 RepID=T2M6V9_HYDVU|nr:mediator of RNA polymerase II transcription subunit 10 [Hydra vulgaris]
MGEVEESSDKYDELQQSIEEFIESSRQIGIMVSDFQPGCQDFLNSKINSLIESMQSIEKSKKMVADVEVPLDIFQYIDQGRNPLLYTKDCLKKTLIKNEEVNAKVEAYKNFQTILETELKQELPQTMERHSQFLKQRHK